MAREAQVERGRRWGRLVLLETIGSGTSCDVYRAWDAELHRDVALKLLHEKASSTTTPRPAATRRRVQARVLQEARRMARLRHEHVVQVYGAEQHDRRVGLWMELVRGTSLEQLVQQRGSFGANEAVLIGLDVCAALAAVHGAGLLHRDVKAQNVMREDGGRIVLMDFGTGEDSPAPTGWWGRRSTSRPKSSAGSARQCRATSTRSGCCCSISSRARSRSPRDRWRSSPAPTSSAIGIAARPAARRAAGVRRGGRARARQRSGSAFQHSASSNRAARIAGPASYRPSARRGTGRDRETASSSQDAVPGGCDDARSAGGGAHRLDARRSTFVVAPASVTRVAVLPFRDMSNQPAAPYLADELTIN